MILFVDDMQERWNNFSKKFPEKAKQAMWAKTAEEACLALAQLGPFDEIWLDHDAGCVEGIMCEDLEASGKRFPLTFRSVCAMLVVMRNPPTDIYLHSGNKAGRDWMESFLEASGEFKEGMIHNLSGGAEVYLSVGESILD